MPTVLTPLLDTMSKAARVAWPHIQAAVERGLGAEEVITALREGGIPSFRRQDMLALIREASGAELLKSDIARWPKDVLFPVNRVRDSITKIVAPFSYTLRVRIEDANGRERTITRQAHSSRLRPLDEVASSFIEAAAAREQYSSFTVLDAEVIDIQKAGGAGVI